MKSSASLKQLAQRSLVASFFIAAFCFADCAPTVHGWMHSHTIGDRLLVCLPTLLCPFALNLWYELAFQRRLKASVSDEEIEQARRWANNRFLMSFAWTLAVGAMVLFVAMPNGGSDGVFAIWPVITLTGLAYKLRPTPASTPTALIGWHSAVPITSNHWGQSDRSTRS